MENINIATAAVLLLACVTILVVMTVLYRREMKWIEIMMELKGNQDRYEKDLDSLVRKYRLSVAFLVSSIIFNLSIGAVSILPRWYDVTQEPVVYIYSSLLLTELISIVASAMFISIIIYKRFTFS